MPRALVVFSSRRRGRGRGLELDFQSLTHSVHSQTARAAGRRREQDSWGGGGKKEARAASTVRARSTDTPQVPEQPPFLPRRCWVAPARSRPTQVRWPPVCETKTGGGASSWGKARDWVSLGPPAHARPSEGAPPSSGGERKDARERNLLSHCPCQARGGQREGQAS